jgi:hypothetical protein
MPALHDGSYVAINRDDANVLAYLRTATSGSDPVLIALNMSSAPQTVNFSLRGFGVNGDSLHVLLAAPEQAGSDLHLTGVKLEPLGVLIVAVR